jgi:alpha-L-rhamnosidase
MKRIFCAALLFAYFSYNLKAQIPDVLKSRLGDAIQKDEISRYYITPKRIVWISDTTGKKVINPKILLNKGNSQTYFGIDKNLVCTLNNFKGDTSGIILDFGTELHGSIQLTTATSNRLSPRVRIRFGESVSETMSDVIGDGTTGLYGGATNHHAMRDFIVTLPGYGTLEIGKSVTKSYPTAAYIQPLMHQKT